MGLDPAPDVQHDLHEAAVIPPGGHGIHQPGKIAALGQALVALLQHVVEGAQHQHPRLPLVAELEIRVQVDGMAALPQKLGAEGVDGGDIRLVDQRGLAAQAAVGGSLCQPGGELLHNARAQLGGGGFGVSDDQKAVDVQSLSRHTGQKPLHQHAGLARPGGGGHQQGSAPVVHHRLLFLCQGKGHRDHLFFDCFRSMRRNGRYRAISRTSDRPTR